MRPARLLDPDQVDTPSLFSPARVGSFLLPNRIVMAPMTRSRASGHCMPSVLASAYYAQRASAGLIISEAAHVSAAGAGHPNTPGMHRADQAASWRRVTDAVHARGGRILVQLWHAGRVSHPLNQPGGALPVAPSPIAPEGTVFTPRGRLPYVAPRELETQEVVAIVEQFAHAASFALAAGFDGVDIHAANGYLLDQFLRDGSNQRGDRYGGEPRNRIRLLREVVEAVCQVWGSDRVGVRLSPLHPGNSMKDSDPWTTFGYAASVLDALGVAYLHVVEPGPGHPMASVEGLGILRVLRHLYRGCLIVDGGRDRASAESAMRAAYADLVAFATPFIANPDLVERLECDHPLAVPDPATYYEGGSRGYTDYPPFGRSCAAS
ncbi:MAG TPA: alkene reductase [Gemmatimonadales bacterium]|jgi:N-ethylmaleimide reductase